MKKGFVVFKYEFFNLLKNKVFLAITIALVVIIAAVPLAPPAGETAASPGPPPWRRSGKRWRCTSRTAARRTR